MEVNVKILRTYFITYKNRNEAIEIAEYLNSIGENVYRLDRIRTRILAPEWIGYKCNLLYGPNGDDIWCLSTHANSNLKKISLIQLQRKEKLKKIQKRDEL